MNVKNGTASSDVVAHHTSVQALGQRLQEVLVEQAEFDADQAENKSVRRQRERDRVAEQQKHNKRREHDRRHVVDEESSHGWPRSVRLQDSSEL